MLSVVPLPRGAKKIRRPICSTLQNILQRISQVGMLELVSTGGELGRFRSLATEKKFLAHLSEDQLYSEGGHRENRRAVQDGCQRAGELGIRHRIRRDAC